MACSAACSHGCGSIPLTRSARDGNGAVVWWNETYPGAGCTPIPLSVLDMRPYGLAAITRVEGDVDFLGGTRAVPCH